jgi:hypothetical protein
MTSYNLKFLENGLKAFTYILSNPIYNNIKNHFSVKNKFYAIYIGLADYYSSSGNKSLAVTYLLKALSNKTNLKNMRYILGVVRQLLTPNKPAAKI